jgi:NADPH:quinone reductase-like Zn-dependent oxidoreductase
MLRSLLLRPTSRTHRIWVSSAIAAGSTGGAVLGCASASAVSSAAAPPSLADAVQLPVAYGPTTLSGNTIIIFGGSSGIGKAIALGAAQQGASTVHIIGRDKQKLARAKAEITQAAGPGTTIFTSSVDVTDEAAVRKFFADIPDESVDHLVTTPGGSAKCGGAMHILVQCRAV